MRGRRRAIRSNLQVDQKIFDVEGRHVSIHTVGLTGLNGEEELEKQLG